MGDAGERERWLGLELGPAGFSAVVVGRDGRVVGQRTGHAPLGLGPRELVNSAVEFVRQVELDLAPAQALGVGLEGEVDCAVGDVVASAHHPFLAGAPLARLFEEALWRPCAVADRVTAVCAGEFEAHTALGAPADTDLVILDVGSSITCQVLQEGRNIAERRGAGPDLAHLRVASGGVPCDEGHRGCLVARATTEAVARRAGAADLSTVFRRAFVSGAAVDSEVELARVALSEAALALGAAVAALVDLHLPDRVALGGLLFPGDDAGRWMFGEVRRSALGRARPAALRRARIDPFLHGAWAGAFGAACLARRAAA